jgi:hypothetical protein
MNILELFAEKYLDNYDVESPLNNGIISNGHCYHHALEYANGDLTVAFSNDLNKNAHIKKCITSSRVDITDLYIELLSHLFENMITQLRQSLSIERTIKKRREIERIIENKTEKHRIKIKKMNDFKQNTEYSEEYIVKQGVILKQKAICILIPYTNQPDALTFRILTNDDIGTRFNVNNILFLINLSTTKKDKKSGKKYPIGSHFITFRNSKCRRVIPTRNFIEIINNIVLNRRSLNGQPIVPIDPGIDGVMEFNFNIQDIDRQIIGDRRLIKLKLLQEIMPVVLPEEPETNSVRKALRQVEEYKKQNPNNNSVSTLSNNSGLTINNEISSTNSAQFERRQSENNSITSGNSGLNLDKISLTNSAQNAINQVANFERRQLKNDGITSGNETPESKRLFFKGSHSSNNSSSNSSQKRHRRKTLKKRVEERRQPFLPKQGTPLNSTAKKSQPKKPPQLKKRRNISL